jgi:ribose transport system substrate-binding protein
MSAQMKKAATVLGWDLTVYDGKFNQDGAYASGVRQAKAAGAQGIIMNGIDCAAVRQPLIEARSVGIKTIGLGAFDCPETSEFSAVVMPNPQQPTLHSFQLEWGRAKAVWLVSSLQGHGKIIDVKVADVTAAAVMDDGFLDVVGNCGRCELVTVQATLSDFSNGGLVQKVNAALVKNPDTKGINVPFDNMVQLAVAPALRSSGAKNVLVVGGEGDAANLDLIRDGAGQSAAIGVDLGWAAWAAMDTLNRIFAGANLVPNGYGFTAVDAGHNLPPKGQQFQSRVDFRSIYTKTWSGSS